MSNLGTVLQREWGVVVGSDTTRVKMPASGRAPTNQTTTPLLETVHACGCFVAISLSFVVYGVLQERMMTVGFGEKQELFSWSLFIVFCNRLLTCIISFGLLVIQRKSIKPVAPVPAYAAVSFGNLVASTCQYDSLKYISFAMQTLAKCCKMLPVMLWGALIGRQRYSAKELAVAGAVMAGCASFIFSGSVLSVTVPEVQSSRYYAIGAGLLLLYLTFDGFTSTYAALSLCDGCVILSVLSLLVEDAAATVMLGSLGAMHCRWQDKLFQGYEMDTSNQVLYTTLCSTVMSFVILVGSSDMAAATAFLKRNPQAWVYILAVSSVAAIIQYFVSYTIKVYGALNFAALMTARQFLSIIASCVIFNHSFSVGQWCDHPLDAQA